MASTLVENDKFIVSRDNKTYKTSIDDIREYIIGRKDFLQEDADGNVYITGNLYITGELDHLDGAGTNDFDKNTVEVQLSGDVIIRGNVYVPTAGSDVYSDQALGDTWKPVADVLTDTDGNIHVTKNLIVRGNIISNFTLVRII